MSKPGRIAAAWDHFAKQILDPIGAPPVQRQEMRRAFYAGAQSLLTIQMRDLDQASDEPTADDLAMMDAIAEELAAFFTSQIGTGGW